MSSREADYLATAGGQQCARRLSAADQCETSFGVSVGDGDGDIDDEKSENILTS